MMGRAIHPLTFHGSASRLDLSARHRENLECHLRIVRELEHDVHVLPERVRIGRDQALDQSEIGLRKDDREPRPGLPPVPHVVEDLDPDGVGSGLQGQRPSHLSQGERPGLECLDQLVDACPDHAQHEINTAGAEDRVQRGLYYAIVDEVDSILIDEARTPLIISGPSGENSERYRKVNELVAELKREEEEHGGDYTVDEKVKQVYLTEEGHQHVERLMASAGLLQEGDLRGGQAGIGR